MKDHKEVEFNQRHLQEIVNLIDRMNLANPMSSEWRELVDKAVRQLLSNEFKRLTRELGS